MKKFVFLIVIPCGAGSPNMILAAKFNAEISLFQIYKDLEEKEKLAIGTARKAWEVIRNSKNATLTVRNLI